VSSDRPRPLALRRILVVDDQPSMRGVLELALGEAGAEVRAAEDGAAALAALASGLPDLILLDLAMPRMDGWQVLERLAADPRTSAIPVVLETSAEDYPSFDRARKRGVAAFISKPFRLHEVIETCRRILEGARPLQGRAVAGPSRTAVELSDPDDGRLVTGSLLDRDGRGAQVELDAAVAPSRRVTLLIHNPQGTETRTAEVRWVTRVGERYCHGLYFAEGGGPTSSHERDGQ
jgi:CheY-like chemotaxis protein